MEVSESIAVFDSLDLNPQLFINEVLNTLDDLLDDAFFVFHEEASMLLKTDGTNRSRDLIQGVERIRGIVQGDLDKQLGLWETHSMRNIFIVPQGFSLPENTELPGESSSDHDAVYNAELDAQLDSLRTKLSMVGKETAELNRELRTLERQSVLRNRCTENVNEALELYEQSSGHGTFQEMIKTAAELRTKMENLKKQRYQEREQTRTERIYNPDKDIHHMSFNKGFRKAELKDLVGFAADLKKI